jgi:hypothetical protein
MGSHDPFKYIKHKLWRKKGQESNCQFDSRPLKIRNRPNLLACKCHATYCWKAFNKGYNFSLDLTSIRGLQKRLWASKVAKVPILGILKVLGQNDIWIQPLWPSTNNTIMRKLVISHKSGSWWILWICVCMWRVRALKML